MDNAKETRTLQKYDRFKATDLKGRTVEGVVLDVLPWSEWPYKCDVRINGMRSITQFNLNEFQHNPEVLK
jgi:hypothetical protein